MKISTKRTVLMLLFFAFACGVLMLFGISSITVFAHEQNETHEHDNLEGGLESLSGYVCNNGVDFQVDLSEKTENYFLELTEGFGCANIDGTSREDGYSSSYPSGCRNWQVMPIISPMFKYWIDESTLSSLTPTQRTQFIADVDGAAAEWNSVRINDYSGAIVNLQKMSSKGIDVVPIRYNPSLKGCIGKFNPIPLHHWIEIKYLNDPGTILHEFGHMIGLQDLDLGKDGVDWSHISLMGYAGNDEMHYQDIQGLAVANNKHTNHDFRKYWHLDGWYNYVCFYCDITDTTEFYGGTHLENASSCLHTYEQLASAGSRYWQKCTNCYKVIESEFTVNVEGSNSVEITGLIDNRTTITIPRQIGGQNVTSIGIGAFSSCTNITNVTFQATSNVTTIGDSAFKGCSSLGSITIPNSVTNIDSNAFENCSFLQSITLSNNLTVIGSSVFKDCASLGSITIPNSVTNIDSNAFENCTSLTNITLSSNLTSIGNSAFKGCISLSSIAIPNSVTSIGQNAFSGCDSLIINWNNTTINIKTANINTTYTGALSIVNKYYWYEYIAPSSGEYSFKTSGTTDTYGELFTNMIYDDSTTGRITYDNNSGDGNNFLINHHLNTGQKVYLRVRGANPNVSGNFGFEINKAIHTHSYNIYGNYYDNLGHRVACICGHSIKEAHDIIIISGKYYCTICPWVGKNVIIVPEQFEDIFSVKFVEEPKQIIINIEDRTRYTKKKE